MKVVHINTFPYKATGTIMLAIHQRLLEEGYDSYAVWGRGRESLNEHEIVIADKWGVCLHGLLTRVTDRTGFASWRATKQLLIKLDEIKPDCIHLHNIHGYYIHIGMLFDYIKKNQIKVVWTLHDCWPFTGHCAYFDMVGCDKWKTGCSHCEQKHTYPASSFMDGSVWNYAKKKELFTGCDITIVTPSKWLKDIVKESFLGEYRIEVINNGIDTTAFRPKVSNFRTRAGIGDKFMILGVASEWTKRKGLQDFMLLDEKLRKSLSGKYKIVLVGLTKKQINELPSAIVGIERTANVEELAEVYSAADVFFNPTYEDNYPTTNIEAVSCGTQVITYCTGGSPETIEDTDGIVVRKGDVDICVDIIKKQIENYSGKRVIASNRDDGMEMMIFQYLQLYQSAN